MASESDFSPITHLLTTNTTPTRHARNTIHGLLSSVDKDICQAESDIAELHKALEQRTAERDGLIQRRASLRGVVSSLRQFPVEILELIFLYVSWDDPKSPIWISHVCWHWRRVSLSNPDLWTAIRIGDQYQESYISSFIQRSRSRPVSLKYTGNLNSPNTLMGLHNLLVGYDCRWKELHVPRTWSYLPKILSKSWDTLESLVLTANWHSQTMVLDLEPATRLTSLSISHEKELNITYKISPGLTHLNLNVQSSLKDVVTLLRMCPNLEECIITLFGSWPTTFLISKPPVHHHKMRKLHIRSRYAASLVNTLKTPVLQDLLLHFGEFGQLQRLDRFVEAHKSTLQKFSISMVTSHNLRHMLKGMENLKELRVFGIGMRHALRALKKDTVGNARRGGILVPNLEVLHVICKRHSDIRKTLLKVVRSRSGSPDGARGDVARLRSVSLQNGENEQLKRQGFDVTILDGPLNNEDADWVFGGQTEMVFDSDDSDSSDSSSSDDSY